jgi:hypothetical protein
VVSGADADSLTRVFLDFNERAVAGAGAGPTKGSVQQSSRWFAGPPKTTLDSFLRFFRCAQRIGKRLALSFGNGYIFERAFD